jgi:peptidoglycan/xylan/chitin deacetylase (PgdA/CDA1 family)
VKATPNFPGQLSRRRFLCCAAAGIAGAAAIGFEARRRLYPDMPDHLLAAASAPAARVHEPTAAFEAKQALKTMRPPLPKLIRTGPADKARIAVTIDDLWTPAQADMLGQVLDSAKARNIKMTFFPTGGAIQDHLASGKQDIWKRVLAEGHEIGNHTYTHSQLPRLTEDQIRFELNHTQELLDQALGSSYSYKMRLLRPPGGGGGVGNGDARILGILGSMGYSMAMWSIDSAYTSGNASYAAKIGNEARNGSIVLTHFATFAPGNFPPLMDRLRNERHLEQTTVTGLFT